MDVKQIYALTNTAVQETLGASAVVAEDLSNLVDIGAAVFGASAVDRYVKSLVNRIGKVIFVNRPYVGSVPSVLMDGWEFGSVLQKIRVDLPTAKENSSWDLTDGTDYSPNTFYQPTVSAKFYNSKVTFEIPMSFTDKQVKQSFTSATELNAFISMLYGSVENAMTIRIDELVMRTINNMIGDTIYADYGTDGLATKSGIKAVNLLYLYNTAFSKTLTAAGALTDADFIKFACYTMKLYQTRLGKMSKLFNIGAKERFTPNSSLHYVLLDEFASAADVYLQSDTFHNELTKLPTAERVPYWQGSGSTYAFTSTSKIDIKTANSHLITASGILGVMFDRNALGVTNPDRRVTSDHNERAEFYNNWFKYDASYFNDSDENFVVFFIA